jgi:DNA-binding GntR family transcriptional regulator
MARLDDAVHKFEQAVATLNGSSILQAKTDFYSALMDGSRDIFLRQALMLLHNGIDLLRAASMMQPGRLRYSAAELREIHDAIKARDGARASAACRHHIAMAAGAAL